MSALPGGGGDKLGNRYEDWWTIVRLTDLLAGKASSLRPEPPGPMGEGIEFWVLQNGVRWCEQVKDASADGPWTPKRLKARKVLTAVHGHLSRGDHVRFVFSTPAQVLHRLADRARFASSVEEYRTSVLRADEVVELDRVAEQWKVGLEEAWRWLRRVEVVHHTPDSLREIARLRCDTLIQGDAGEVIAHLRDWLVAQLHQEITQPKLRSHLRDAGYPLRLLVGDRTTFAALVGTVDRQRRRVESRHPPLDLVAEPHTQRLLDRLGAPEGAQIPVLHGPAGSGKSTVATNAVSYLAARGWFTAAVSLDHVAESMGTARALGEAFGLADGPVTLLGAVADGQAAALLVDQLDAVSSYSGRVPALYESVHELLEQARTFPALKVVLVVRSVDLAHDPRLRQLEGNQDTETYEIGLLDLGEVRSALLRLGIDPAATPTATLELLRVPLHFAVFSHLTPDAQRGTYLTLAGLFEQRTTEARQRISRELGHLDWQKIVDPLLAYMSEQQVLDAPDYLLDDADPNEVAALDSHGLLSCTGPRVAFFHESYFDYLFARRFVAAGNDLVQLLEEGGQELFRRAQVRQVLEHLVSADRPRFRHIVARLLNHATIRSHLKEVVGVVLERLDATGEDWEMLEPYVFDGRAPRRLEYLPGQPAWFDAIDSLGRWPSLLDDPGKAEIAGHQLIVAARHEPGRVVELTRPYVGASDEWRLRIQGLLIHSRDGAVLSFAADLLARGELDAPPGGFADHRNLWSAIASTVYANPLGAVQLVAAYLRRAAERARAQQADHPFAAGFLTGSAEAIHALGELSTLAPEHLVAEIVPVMLQIAEQTRAPAAQDELQRWGISPAGGLAGSTGQALVGALDHALQALTRREPTALATSWGERLAATEVRELRFLACRIFTTTVHALRWTGRADQALAWLCSDSRNLHLGWADSSLWASRDLLATTTRYCSPAQLDTAAAQLLEYYPWWENSESADDPPPRGRAQQHLLSAIPVDRRSTVLIERIAELGMAFPDDEPVPPGTPPTAVGGPPIPPERLGKLDDQQWLDTIDEFSTSKPQPGHPFDGGGRALSGQLSERARVEPERFARLALAFGADTAGMYFDRVIDATAEQIPINLLVSLCRHARAMAPADVGSTICRAIGAHAADVTVEAVSLLEDYAADPAPAPGSATLFPASSDLVNRGLNTIRGAAAAAIAQLLFASTTHVAQLIAPLSALATDPDAAVRACAADAIIALAATHADVAVDLSARLFDGAPIEMFAAPTINRLLRYALERRPEYYSHHLATALAGPEVVAQATGGTWAFAWVNELLRGNVPTDIRALPSAARQGAAAALATKPSLAVDELIDLLDDPDESVRTAAASASRFVSDLDQDATQRFVAALTTSTSADEHLAGLLAALDRSEQRLPVVTLQACQTVISRAGSALADYSSRQATVTPSILNLLLRLYRDAPASLRGACLDEIDRLCESGAARGLEGNLEQRR